MENLGVKKGCKSRNSLIYNLVGGERGLRTKLSYFVVYKRPIYFDKSSV